MVHSERCRHEHGWHEAMPRHVRDEENDGDCDPQAGVHDHPSGPSGPEACCATLTSAPVTLDDPDSPTGAVAAVMVCGRLHTTEAALRLAGQIMNDVDVARVAAGMSSDRARTG